MSRKLENSLIANTGFRNTVEAHTSQHISFISPEEDPRRVLSEPVDQVPVSDLEPEEFPALVSDPFRSEHFSDSYTPYEAPWSDDAIPEHDSSADHSDSDTISDVVETEPVQQILFPQFSTLPLELKEQVIERAMQDTFEWGSRVDVKMHMDGRPPELPAFLPEICYASKQTLHTSAPVFIHPDDEVFDRGRPRRLQQSSICQIELRCRCQWGRSSGIIQMGW